MGYVLTFIFGFLGSSLAPLIAKVLLALGISLVSYAGVDALMSGLSSQLSTLFGSFSSSLIAISSMMGIGQFLTLILSAYVAGFAFQSSAGVLRSIKITGGGRSCSGSSLVNLAPPRLAILSILFSMIRAF